MIKKIKELTEKQKEALLKKEKANEEKQFKNDAKQFVKDIDKKYHALPYFSASALKSYELNPSLYLYNKLHGQTSDALTFGTIVHKLILENKDFEENRKKYEIVLQPKQRETLLKIEKAFKNSAYLTGILKSAKFIEKEIIFDLDVSNKKEKCKSKIDLFSLDNILIDLKTCQNLDYFRKDIDNYRYDIQMSFYKKAIESLGEKVKSVMILAVEKSPPYDMQFFRLSDNFIKRGENGGSINSKYVRGWKDAILDLSSKDLKTRFKDDIEEIEVYE